MGWFALLCWCCPVVGIVVLVLMWMAAQQVLEWVDYVIQNIDVIMLGIGHFILVVSTACYGIYHGFDRASESEKPFVRLNCRLLSLYSLLGWFSTKIAIGIVSKSDWAYVNYATSGLFLFVMLFLIVLCREKTETNTTLFSRIFGIYRPLLSISIITITFFGAMACGIQFYTEANNQESQYSTRSLGIVEDDNTWSAEHGILSEDVNISYFTKIFGQDVLIYTEKSTIKKESIVLITGSKTYYIPFSDDKQAYSKIVLDGKVGYIPTECVDPLMELEYSVASELAPVYEAEEVPFKGTVYKLGGGKVEGVTQWQPISEPLTYYSQGTIVGRDLKSNYVNQTYYYWIPMEYGEKILMEKECLQKNNCLKEEYVQLESLFL